MEYYSGLNKGGIPHEICDSTSMECPDRAVKYPRVVDAPTEKEAVILYNIATKATYYKGEVMFEVTDALSNLERIFLSEARRSEVIS